MSLSFDTIKAAQSAPGFNLATAAQAATIPAPASSTPAASGGSSSGGGSSSTIYGRGTTGGSSGGGGSAPLTPAPIPGAPTTTPTQPQAYTSSFMGGDGKMHYWLGSTDVTDKVNGTAPATGGSPNLPSAPVAPGSAQSYQTAAENSPGVQTQLDTIRQSFADQLATQTDTNTEKSAQTNYESVSRGLVGTPDAAASEDKTNKSNAAAVKTVQDNQAVAIADVLQKADTNAIALAQLDQSKYNTDYTNWSAQMATLKTDAQAQFATLAATATGSWDDFVKAAPDSAQKLIDQTGYDPAVVPFLWNNLKTKAQQITYDATPVQMPDGTYMMIGHDPTKTGPDSIVRTKIDTAPDGFTTTVVGGLPYWQSTDGSGAMYPVPSDKGQFITLKDAAGNNYLYNTYTKQYLNPLGADTSGNGVSNPNAPASPLTGASTLNDLMSYYVNGSTGEVPGVGYMGAVMQSLGITDGSTVTLDQLKDKIPDLMAGIIKAEGSPALAKVNNGGAILWSTAQAYGFDTTFNATPIQMMGSNGKMMTYAQFPDSQSGTQALQSYLTSVMSGGNTEAAGTYNGWNTADASIPKNETAYTPIPQLDNRTPSAITQNAIAYALQGGNLQQFVGGLSSKDPKTQAIKNAIDNKAAALATSAGTTLAQLRMDYKSATAAQKGQVDFANQVSRALNGAEQGAALTTKLFAGKQINTNDSTWANATINDLVKKFGDSGDIRAYQAAMVEIGNEYAQVFARGGQRSIEGNKIAQDIVNGNLKLSDIQKSFDTLQQIGQTVIGTAVQQMNSLAVPDSLIRFNALVSGQPANYTPDINAGSSGTSGSVDGFDYTVSP